MRMSLEILDDDEMQPQQRTPGVLEQLDSDLPASIGAPARRALISVGVWRLDQLTALTEAELLKLHGFGPKALRILKEELGTKGLSFRTK